MAIDTLGSVPEWQMFQTKMREVNGEQKIVGFSAPDGNHYDLADGEELVKIKKPNGQGRDVFIRKDGVDVLFEEWKKDKRK